MRIAVDAMGGDHAPEHPVAGAILAARELGADVVLVGQEDRIREVLQRHPAPPNVSIVHADQVTGSYLCGGRNRNGIALPRAAGTGRTAASPQGGVQSREAA